MHRVSFADEVTTMAVLATVLGTLAGVLWAMFIRQWYRGELRYHYRTVRRADRPGVYWQRMAILGVGAVLATLAVIITIAYQLNRL